MAQSRSGKGFLAGGLQTIHVCILIWFSNSISLLYPVYISEVHIGLRLHRYDAVNLWLDRAAQIPDDRSAQLSRRYIIRPNKADRSPD